MLKDLLVFRPNQEGKPQIGGTRQMHSFGGNTHVQATGGQQ
ncbi:hypothetical protein [Paenibacillus sp. E222]|nr:hypothetical protein [Paenibacillus sp. E222]